MKRVLTLLFCSCLSVAVFSDAASDKAENLLQYDFSKLDAQGLPVGYKVFFDEHSNGKITVSEEAGTNVVKLEMPEQGQGHLDSNYLLDLQKNKKYILSLQLKVKDQYYAGGPKQHSFTVYVYNSGNGKHIYNQIFGHGSTDGWLTVVLPVDTEKNPDLVGARLLLRGNAVSGTYWLKKPMLVEIPTNLEIKAHFILENDKTIPSHALRLEALSQMK